MKINADTQLADMGCNTGWLYKNNTETTFSVGCQVCILRNKIPTCQFGLT